MITAVDGALTGGGSTDTFRIKIWAIKQTAVMAA